MSSLIWMPKLLYVFLFIKMNSLFCWSPIGEKKCSLFAFWWVHIFSQISHSLNLSWDVKTDIKEDGFESFASLCKHMTSNTIHRYSSTLSSKYLNQQVIVLAHKSSPENIWGQESFGRWLTFMLLNIYS